MLAMCNSEQIQDRSLSGSPTMTFVFNSMAISGWRTLERLPVGHVNRERFERPVLRELLDCFAVHGFAFEKGRFAWLSPTAIIPPSTTCSTPRPTPGCRSGRK